MRGSSTRPRAQRGAASVEFALVASLLITLILAVISYSYMLSFRQGLSQGAAEGARAAVMAAVNAPQSPDPVNAVNAVNEVLSSYGVTCSIPSGTTGTLTRNAVVVGECSVAFTVCANDPAHTCAVVSLGYLYRDNALVPSFPGMGVLLPAKLSYTSTARVS